MLPYIEYDQKILTNFGFSIQAWSQEPLVNIFYWLIVVFY